MGPPSSTDFSQDFPLDLDLRRPQAAFVPLSPETRLLQAVIVPSTALKPLVPASAIRAGQTFIELFAFGAKGIEAFQKEARQLGLTMSSEEAKVAEDFTDALDAL